MLLVNKIFNISLVAKVNIKTKYMYFLIKYKIFLKFGKKLAILSKKIKKKKKRELMYNKIYLEAEKKLTQKKAFIVFVNEFTNTFLIDSV